MAMLLECPRCKCGTPRAHADMGVYCQECKGVFYGAEARVIEFS